MKFEINTTYYSRSICDHECIFEITVIARTDKRLIYDYEGRRRTSNIRNNSEGNEYIRPDSYSMAPIFRSDRKKTA